MFFWSSLAFSMIQWIWLFDLWFPCLFLTQKLMQCINGLNVKTKTIKFLNENTGSKLLDIQLSDNFLNLIPKGKKKKKKNKWDNITKKLLYSRENDQQNEQRQPMEQEKHTSHI